jgi:hypothetical protein
LVNIFKEGICRYSQGSPVQRGSPDREDTTLSSSTVELELIFSGRTSRRTPSVTVLTSSLQHIVGFVTLCCWLGLKLLCYLHL